MTIQIPGDLPVDQDASGDDGALRGDRLGARAGLSSSPLQVGGDFVFIDSRVPDIQDLVNGVKPGERVFVISSDQDGLTQIANILAANHAQNLASISIVSHGSVGEIEIGSTILNDGTLSAHADALSAIGATLQPGGDVQLFSCNTAQGAVGAQFIGDLSTLLGGADVAASTHNVGSASAGGSFLLDSATGTIDAVSPFTGQATGSFDGTLAGTISGQAWYGANGGGTRSIVGHINSDGSSPTQQGDESGVGEVQAKSVGIDLAAGFYFQTDDTTNRTISSYDYVTGNVISTVQIGDLAGAGTGDDDIVNALAVDPLHNTIYVGKWGQTSALSGIIKLTYNTSTGVLDPNAAYNASPLFIVHSNSGIDDIRGVAVDPINQVVYFTTNNSTLNTGGFSYTNALWRVNSDGSSLTQMTTGAQFPAVAQASQQNALGAVVYDAAKGLVYFETHEQGVVNTTKLWYISSSATGGTATQVSLPGGTVLATGDTPQAGLTLDAQNQQLYIVVQSGTGVAATDQMLVGQLSADGHSITSIVQTYSYATLDGQSHTANEHITGATFDLLPVLAITGTTTHAVEQSASIVLPASESSTDADSNHYAGATVQITGGTFSSNESSANDDHLTINGAITGTVAGTSITLSYVAATETLTLSGYDTVAHYDAALALVKYNTTGDNPTNYGSNTTRTITWTLDDGALNIPSGQQNSGTTTLTVDGVNDATTLATSATISYTEQAAAATIDNAITVSDPDNLNEASATVVISAGFQTGDTLSANVSGTSITITSFNAGGNHTLILTGSDTLAHYQQVLRTVTFQNSTNDDPTAGGTATSRTIQYQTDDGTADPLHLSNTISATVNITAVNDAPAAVAPGTHYAATEQTSLSLKNTGISVSDVDGSSGSETLTLSVGEGTLNATAGTSGAGVSGSGTGTLTITGTIAQLNAFLNTDGTSTFTYIDNTDTPSASTTLSVSINDNGHTGTGGSLVGSASSTIDITAVNDAPTATAAASAYSATEQVSLNLKNTGMSVADPDGGGSSETLTLSVGEGTLTATAGNSGAGIGGSGTGTITVSGTIAQINAFLNTATSTLVYIDNTDTPSASTTLSMSINDNGHTGTGGALVGSASQTINITAVNDAPAAVAPGTHYAATEQTSLSLKNTGISVSDVDGASSSETLTLSVGEGTLSATAGTSGAGVSGSGTGTLTITGTIAQLNAFLNTDGTSTFTYIDNTDTPSASTTLSVSINDNGNTGTGGSQIGSASSTIDITAVNDAPVPNVPGVDYTATEQVVLSLKNTGLSITDDGGAGSETVTISVGEGTLTATAGTSGAGISGNGTGTLTITGTVAQINDLLNTNGTSTIAYIDNTDTPSASTTLSVHVDDNGNSGTGGALTGDASVTIDITAVNDAPTALMTTDPYAAIEQTTLNLKGTGMSVGDVDSLGASERITLSVGEGTLTVTVGDSGVSIFSGNGTSSVVIDGTIAQLNALLGAGGTSTLTYIDNTDSPSASTTLTLQVNDQGNTGTGGAQTGTDTSTINITAVNDAPSGADNTVTTLEDTAYVFAAADFGFSDATDGGANALLAVEITTLPAAGTLTDNGVAVTAGQFVSVADINSGLLVFTPASNLNGAGYASFTFQVQDNGGTANGGVDTDPTPKTMTVDVTSVNDAPAGANNTVTTLEDTGYTFAAADFGFSDPNDSPANTLLAVEITTLPAAGTLTDNGVAVVAGQFVSVADITSGKLVFTPAANANGSGYASFTFQVQDNGGTAVGGVDTDPTPRTMTIDVTAVNDAPVVANAGSTVAYTEGNAPVTLESALTISDVDSANLVGATISLSGFFAGDELKISNNTSGTIVNGGNTITYSYNAGTGTLTLSGSDTVADYQAALRLVTYDSTSLNPTNYGALPSRDVGWTVDDGSASNNNSTPVDTTINITAVDSPAVAKDDNLTTDEYTAIGAGLNLFNDNGHGVDFDPDNTSISIASVTGGPGANVGTQFMLNSGALLTVHTDGTFSYDPNHAFDSLHLAAPGSGAANTTATDTFSYTLAGGGSATVTLTIDGVDDANTIYQGTPGNDTITGSPTVGSVYHLEQGGDDTVTGGSGNDGFYFGAAFNGNDSVHGGAGGNDQLGLEGDYSGGVTLDGSKVDGVEVLAMLPGFNYNITTLDNFVPAGQTFTFWSVSMGPANHVTLDGSAELDGKFNFYLGQGNDIAKGGAGADVLYGDGGADTLTGGGGADIFGYLQVSDSHGNANGTAYDRITDFAAGTDHFRLAGLSVSAVDSIVNGSLSSASFETDLTNSFGPAVPHELAAAHAVIFHVTGGGLSGHDFLIVNAHGAAGYSAGNDYVVDVTGYTGTVATSDFI